MTPLNRDHLHTYYRLNDIVHDVQDINQDLYIRFEAIHVYSEG